jgi:hypothetical protein
MMGGICGADDADVELVEVALTAAAGGAMMVL